MVTTTQAQALGIGGGSSSSSAPAPAPPSGGFSVNAPFTPAPAPAQNFTPAPSGGGGGGGFTPAPPPSSGGGGYSVNAPVTPAPSPAQSQVKQLFSTNAPEAPPPAPVQSAPDTTAGAARGLPAASSSFVPGAVITPESLNAARLQAQQTDIQNLFGNPYEASKLSPAQLTLLATYESGQYSAKSQVEKAAYDFGQAKTPKEQANAAEYFNFLSGGPLTGFTVQTGGGSGGSNAPLITPAKGSSLGGISTPSGEYTFTAGQSYGYSTPTGAVITTPIISSLTKSVSPYGESLISGSSIVYTYENANPAGMSVEGSAQSKFITEAAPVYEFAGAVQSAPFFAQLKGTKEAFGSAASNLQTIIQSTPYPQPIKDFTTLGVQTIFGIPASVVGTPEAVVTGGYGLVYSANKLASGNSKFVSTGIENMISYSQQAVKQNYPQLILTAGIGALTIGSEIPPATETANSARATSITFVENERFAPSRIYSETIKEAPIVVATAKGGAAGYEFASALPSKNILSITSENPAAVYGSTGANYVKFSSIPYAEAATSYTGRAPIAVYRPPLPSTVGETGFGFVKTTINYGKGAGNDLGGIGGEAGPQNLVSSGQVIAKIEAPNQPQSVFGAVSSRIGEIYSTRVQPLISGTREVSTVSPSPVSPAPYAVARLSFVSRNVEGAGVPSELVAAQGKLPEGVSPVKAPSSEAILSGSITVFRNGKATVLPVKQVQLSEIGQLKFGPARDITLTNAAKLLPEGRGTVGGVEPVYYYRGVEIIHGGQVNIQTINSLLDVVPKEGLPKFIDFGTGNSEVYAGHYLTGEKGIVVYRDYPENMISTLAHELSHSQAEQNPYIAGTLKDFVSGVAKPTEVANKLRQDYTPVNAVKDVAADISGERYQKQAFGYSFDDVVNGKVRFGTELVSKAAPKETENIKDISSFVQKPVEYVKTISSGRVGNTKTVAFSESVNIAEIQTPFGQGQLSGGVSRAYNIPKGAFGAETDIVSLTVRGKPPQSVIEGEYDISSATGLDVYRGRGGAPGPSAVGTGALNLAGSALRLSLKAPPTVPLLGSGFIPGTFFFGEGVYASPVLTTPKPASTTQGGTVVVQLRKTEQGAPINIGQTTVQQQVVRTVVEPKTKQATKTEEKQIAEGGGGIEPTQTTQTITVQRPQPVSLSFSDISQQYEQLYLLTSNRQKQQAGQTGSQANILNVNTLQITNQTQEQKQSQRTDQMQGFGQLSLSGQLEDQLTRQQTDEATLYRFPDPGPITSSPPPPPPPPPGGGFGLPSDFSVFPKKNEPKEKTTGEKPGYQPSLIAIQLGIYGKKEERKGYQTGIGIRPIPVETKKLKVSATRKPSISNYLRGRK